MTTISELSKTARTFEDLSDEEKIKVKSAIERSRKNVGTATVKDVSKTKTVKKFDIKDLTHEEYRKLYKNAKSNYSRFVETKSQKSLDNANKYIDTLRQNGVKVIKTKDKLIIER